jgi:type IV pilus assembly protein PilY1
VTRLARFAACGCLLADCVGFATSALAAEEDSPECASVAVGRASVKVVYDAGLAAAGGAGVIVFAGSESGEIAAIEEASGRVLWKYRPPELAAARVGTGLMTDLAVLRFDANNDGFIDADNGDRVWLYFGLKRGGPRYVALDVTHRAARPLWTAGADTLEGLSDAWSTPAIARVRIGGATQNGEHFALIVGGGYAGNAGGTAAAGNRLFMLDAATGRLLWSASERPGADLVSTRMTHAFAARVTAVDLDGDEFADRLYAADVGASMFGTVVRPMSWSPAVCSPVSVPFSRCGGRPLLQRRASSSMRRMWR